MINIVLTPLELIDCHKSPDVLRALAEIHDCKATEADAIGAFESSVDYHERRAEELRLEAERLEKEL